MALELVKEKWSNAVSTLTIGAIKEEGGTRQKVVQCGGEESLPFLFSEGKIPHRPVIAMEILDTPPDDWPLTLTSALGSAIKNPVEWAIKCEKEFKADLLCLRLAGAHPDAQNKPVDHLVKVVIDVLKVTTIPLILVGCGEDKRDNEVLPRCSQAAKGEKILIGEVVQDNYKTLTASVLADGHSIIAQSPIDINIAKQLNILITDMSLPHERIAINPTVGALGYGLEYAYSIMERARLAALSGDKMLAMPFICFVGYEAWRAKEAKALVSEFPSWGAELDRGVTWEALTATAFLQSGANIMVMRHPKSAELVRNHIDELMRG
ncbi:MAG: acetyl-CoA decarbonylase/synthase complex subunit delta [Omnitrophica WOR_2 bacterium GWF2_43_52]|nr:MAG: acetyl-CoA decarbonylase/synthase complex subunit delta [Omnitrophica WOR_2 bacterium GWC2_44_8]OGX20965.1 MAG: acetyl-CoA decarbonylase/synthase complex subunit delta [Omnitrophica WOR_2 bacterium GWF2_43_52]OGX52858.1 MAG: acetyl-CoA decarbonylase/synthase complex subunit delta [Omnitrophica WOR_2 bacterium RIFOXYC2_FULL_43_9]HAH21144.1 acetyl-CoA decarbonylase/synthase complex subunit delta [Candidatus Omnitrophota bacterium]HBG63254.1 acetyl-CoA decarbonylase/synthase complex subuni